MRLEWLGDALDFWKGAFLDVVRKSVVPTRPLKVLPMFTDCDWGEPETARSPMREISLRTALCQRLGRAALGRVTSGERQ